MPETYNAQSSIELAELPTEECLIKVIGVGGGGSNAVNYIYSKAVEGVECIALNTDAKALSMLEIPNKVAIGVHGSGAKPEVSRKAAEDHEEEIKSVLRGAEMVFIAAGLGKGTGTGASPIVAKIAKEMGILTIGVVTIPFRFEGRIFVTRALEGLDNLREHVDSLLIIANEQIKSIYGSLKLSTAFNCANDVIATAINGISGAVTATQGVCTDMEDMRTTLKSGQNVMMGVGLAEGEDRAILAIRDALESPLLVNNDIKGGQRIILNYATSSDNEITLEEMEIINDELKNRVGYYGDQIWGMMTDESLGEKLKVTVVVTGINGIANDDLMELTLGKKQPATAKSSTAMPPKETATGTTSIAGKVMTTPSSTSAVTPPPFGSTSVFSTSASTSGETHPQSAKETFPATSIATQQVETERIQTVPDPRVDIQTASDAPQISSFGSQPAAQTQAHVEVATATIAERQPAKTYSIDDFDDPDFSTDLDGGKPLFNLTQPNLQSSTYIGNDPDNPIRHNDFLNNNVD